MKKYLIIFIAVMLLFMGVFDISYSNAKYKVVSIYDNFYSVVSKISSLVFNNVGLAVSSDDLAFGTYNFQGERLSVMNYVVRETGIEGFIEKWNSDDLFSGSYILSLENFKISNKMYLVHTSKGNYYCYKIIIDTDEKAVNCDGVYYREAYDGYFPSVFVSGVKYKYLREGIVFDSYINFFNQTNATSLEKHVNEIEETDWTVNDFVNTQKID